MAEMEMGDSSNGKELKKTAEQLREKFRIVEENGDEEMDVAWDDVSGAELNLAAVRKARAEEIDCEKDGFVHERPNQ